MRPTRWKGKRTGFAVVGTISSTEHDHNHLYLHLTTSPSTVLLFPRSFPSVSNSHGPFVMCSRILVRAEPELRNEVINQR